MKEKRILIVGSGGREHALAWKIAQSPFCKELFVAPGNAGTREWNVAIDANDIEGLLKFAQEKAIDLTVVGPEEPLSLGIVNVFQKAGLKIFGPTLEAARLESSKAFAKDIMIEARVPTADHRVFTNYDEACRYLEKKGAPIVIKADGLAAGKGVIVAHTKEEALTGLQRIMGGSFGDAGKKVVIEEYLEGPEVSLLCFCDGHTALPMVAVQDHKRALDGDLGLNTGGMGTYSPPPFWTEELEKEVLEKIAFPTLKVMAQRGTPFKGVLFLGLMITSTGPKLLEYNARFGDPETQVVMQRLQSDLLPVLEACIEGRLNGILNTWHEETSICVIMAAPGYPGSYAKGIPLTLPKIDPATEMIFHAGTGWKQDKLVSTGGRVLGVTVRAPSLKEAREHVYGLIQKIGFEGAHYRTDIGLKG
ncbi:MAG: phosphoribosylamine--glycine ligase [Desulfitobacteriia bacterium]|jgi:phosphoribosylamine--glycine ligase